MACAVASRVPDAPLRPLSFIYTLLVLFLGCAFAQDASTGALRGTVVDSTGSRITGAAVVLVNDATGFRYSVTSNSNGQFVFQLLPPGDYTGRATAPGMSPQDRKSVV